MASVEDREVTLARTSDLVRDAVDTGDAVLAFNVITLEHAEAIVAGAVHVGRPVILQLSENAIRFHGGSPLPILAACRELAADARADIAIHLDHVQDLLLATTAIGSAGRVGVTSIMVDAAHLPYEANVTRTAELAGLAHESDWWVEAELGEVGGKDGAHAPGVRTDPAEAADFVATTGVDGLAVAVGSSHAMTEQRADLDLDLIGRLAGTVPVPLVLHGSSGVPDAVLRAAVAAGIRKVNVGTALNVAFTGAVRAHLDAHPATTDPRKYLSEARTATTDAVTRLLEAVAR